MESNRNRGESFRNTITAIRNSILPSPPLVKPKASVNPFSPTLANTREKFSSLSWYEKSQALAPWFGIASALYGFSVEPNDGTQLAGSLIIINVLTVYTGITGMYIFDLTIGCQKLSTRHELCLFLHSGVIHAFSFVIINFMLTYRMNQNGTGAETTDVLSLIYHIFMGIVATLRFGRVLIVRSCKRVNKLCEEKFGPMWNTDDIDDEVGNGTIEVSTRMSNVVSVKSPSDLEGNGKVTIDETIVTETNNPLRERLMH